MSKFLNDFVNKYKTEHMLTSDFDTNKTIIMYIFGHC